MSVLKRIIILLVVLAVSISADQTVKIIAKKELSGKEVQSYIGDTVRLMYMENPGAFLGLGNNLPEVPGFIILIILPAIVLLCLAVYSIFSKSLSGIGFAALVLILAGGIGNLIDRFLHNRLVSDFLNFGIGEILRTGVMNLADLYVAFGAVLLFIEFSREKKRPAILDNPPENTTKPR